MPLLDHFHPPLAPQRHWESFHVKWAGAIADDLNDRLLPNGYFAEEHTHLGARVEIDVATFVGNGTVAANDQEAGAGASVATAPRRTWTPPAPTVTIPATFPDQFEVLVFESEGGAKLVAAVELVSPANKDRPDHRRAFAIKVASYLCRGIGAIIIDIVTSRAANLHREIMAILGQKETGGLPNDSSLYAVAYRPIVRDHAEQWDLWIEALAVGQALPVLPLALNAEICLPLDLETTYSISCQRRRLPS